VFACLILNSVRILIFGQTYYSLYDSFSNYILFMIGPLIFLITEETIGKKTNEALHLIPALIVIGLLSISLSFFRDTDFHLLFEKASFFLLLISILFYLLSSIRLVLRNKTKVSKTVHFVIFGFFIIWHTNLIIQLLVHQELIQQNSQIWGTLLLSFLSIALSYTHILEILNKRKLPKEGLVLSSEKKQAILQKIHTHLKPDVLAQKDFNLQKFSRNINIPSSYISNVVNSELGMSFPKYIGKLRVQQFVENCKEGGYSQLTIQALAEKAGFNSSATFNSAFKREMDMLPSAYLKSLKAK